MLYKYKYYYDNIRFIDLYNMENAMNKKSKVIKPIAIAVICVFVLAGCGQKEYYSAIKEQNQYIAEMSRAAEDNKRIDENAHQETMIVLLQQAMTSASKTPSVVDDVLVPMLVMNMESQRTMAKALTAGKERPMQLQQIKAPDSVGDTIRKSTGLILGAGGLILGIAQSNNMKDIAVAGMNAAGSKMSVTGDGNTITSDSNKNGTDNIIRDSQDTTISGKSCPECNKKEEGHDNRPEGWEKTCTPEFLQSIPGFCSSCDSYYAGNCSVKPGDTLTPINTDEPILN